VAGEPLWSNGKAATSVRPLVSERNAFCILAFEFEPERDVRLAVSQ
jgi:hypothetical protein